MREDRLVGFLGGKIAKAFETKFPGPVAQFTF
jgi:hypothetical protein